MLDCLLNLHHVGVVVQDLNASVAWYGSHPGFERIYDFGFPGTRAAMIARGNVRLELFQTEGSKPMEPEREQGQTNLQIGGINHLAITVDDVDRAVAELKAKGVDIASPPYDVPNGSGARFAFVHDNERMLIELFQLAP